ncbi:TIGR03032 family protein [Rheinheimera sp. NSM]|uniref:TIGR03032 family protein n=1 Tax=Rheinheimera sp. NSM TaxID=3457884 RepID=UPI004035EF3A
MGNLRNSNGAQRGTGAADSALQVEYSQSGGLVTLLTQLSVSLAVSSYQAGLLYLIGRNPMGGLNVHEAAMPKPMGLSWHENGQLILAGGMEILRFENILGPHERLNGSFDACFVPRNVHTTGRLDAHDVGVASDGQVIFVNTRFNCLATLSSRHSFTPIWLPPFIDRIVDEDRCHLNGLAMRDGKPAFVTAVSRSNTVDGWRDRRVGGGVVVEVQTGRIVCDGLSMPHSPRWHDGRLWLLNSGTGELGVVEGLGREGEHSGSQIGHFRPVAFCPGFLRGLAFCGNYAIVALSKPRYKRFEGLPLEQRLKEADSSPWCGVQIIDLKTGSCVEWFRIDGDVAELYDVEILPGFHSPMALSLGSPELAKLITWNRTEASLDLTN